MTEKEMRELEAPSPKTEKALLAFVKSMIKEPGKSQDAGEGYGKCVYAMSLSAVATFNYVAHVLGVTGFQASCADLDIIRRTRRMERFRIVNYVDLLYPQYFTDEHFPGKAGVLKKNAGWLREEAAKRLKENAGACQEVRKWWEYLASLPAPKKEDAE